MRFLESWAGSPCGRFEMAQEGRWPRDVDRVPRVAGLVAFARCALAMSQMAEHKQKQYLAQCAVLAEERRALTMEGVTKCARGRRREVGDCDYVSQNV